MWGISLGLLQQSAARAPYLGQGVSPYGRPSWPWTSSSRPACTRAAIAYWGFLLLHTPASIWCCHALNLGHTHKHLSAFFEVYAELNFPSKHTYITSTRWRNGTWVFLETPHSPKGVSAPRRATAIDFKCHGFLVCLNFKFVVVQLLTGVHLCNPTDCSTLSFPVLHHLLELAQTNIHWADDAIQPFHLLLTPFPALNLSQHQGFFQLVGSLHQVAKILELQQQSFQWIFRVDLL